MPYSHEQIEQMANALDDWRDRGDDLVTSLLVKRFRDQQASEFALHGLARRHHLLLHCVERVFELIPPNDARPSSETVWDVTAHLQSFVVNIYGAIDNLARIWLREANITGANGRPLPAKQIGFGPGNIAARTSLPVEFRHYLEGSDDWFRYLENYRHALAHRIPLYIPPKALDADESVKYQRLEKRANEVVRDRDWAAWRKILAEQAALGTFVPVMMHSFGEAAKPVRFHAQMICDYSTVVEVGEYTLCALEALEAI